MKLSNFSAFSLTKAEMKNLIGGACTVCSANYKTGGGTCGNKYLSQSASSSLVSQLNGSNDGYYYWQQCL